MNISSATIVIIGGASGLGFSTATALKQAGANIILVDNNPDSLQRSSEKLECPGYCSDVTMPEEVDRMVAAICDKHGVPQGVVNSAGILRSSPLISIARNGDHRHSLELWQSVIDTNLTAVFLLARAFADRMIRERVRGVFVNFSSISARGNAGQCAYAAAKAGVEAMTRVWAKELGPLGLRFVAIAPGFIDTPSTRAAVPEQALETLRRETPLRRLGTVEQVAQSVLFALTNDGMTGATIAVDGGLVV